MGPRSRLAWFILFVVFVLLKMKRQKTEDHCSQYKKFKSDEDEKLKASNADVEISSNTEENLVVSGEKISYLHYFKYETKDTEKIAVCLLCEKKRVTKIIKRKNANTSGLKHHLKTHPAEYKTMFPTESKTELKGQTTLNHNSFVSVYSCNFNVMRKKIRAI